MALGQKSELEIELGQLYDLRSRKSREERIISHEAEVAKKDIQMLSVMFSDEVKDMIVPMTNDEALEWDSKNKRLIFHQGEFIQFVEGARNEILIKIRPYLKDLVKKAKACYV